MQLPSRKLTLSRKGASAASGCSASSRNAVSSVGRMSDGLRSALLVLPVARLPLGQPLDRRLEPAPARVLALRLGEPLDVLAPIARAERVEGRARLLALR